MALPEVRVKVTADTKSAEAGLDRVQREMRETGRVASRSSGHVRSVGHASVFTGGKARMLTQQLSQVAQQATATGQVGQALAVQAADIGLAFGVVGTVVGALAGIALPTLINSFSGTSDQTAKLDDALEKLNETIDASMEAAELLSGNFEKIRDIYGDVTSQTIALARANADLRLRDLADQSRELNEELTALYDGNAWLNVSRAEDLANGLDLSTNASRFFAQAMVDLSRADTLGQQLAIVERMREEFQRVTGGVENMTAAQVEFFAALVDSEKGMIRLRDVTEDLQNPMTASTVAGENLRIALDGSLSAAGSLLGVADSLSTSIANAADNALNLFTNLVNANAERAKWIADAQATGGGRGTVVPNASDILMMGLGGEWVGSTDDGSSIGGGRASQVDSIDETTERIREALERRAGVWMDHYQRIEMLTQGSTTDQAGAWGDYFTNLISLTGSSNEKLLKLGKAFAASQALIDAWTAHNRVLADPALPWWARVASAVQVLGAGLGAVSAINSVGSGGGGSRRGAGGGAAASGASASAPSPLEARISGISPDSLFTGSSITSLFDALQEEAGDRGLKVSFAQ